MSLFYSWDMYILWVLVIIKKNLYWSIKMKKYTGQVNYRKTPDFSGEIVSSHTRYDDLIEFSKDHQIVQRNKVTFNPALYKDVSLPVRLNKDRLKLSHDETVFVLRQCVKVPNGELLLPKELDFVSPVLDRCVDFQKEYFENFDEVFIYLTVRNGLVSTRNDMEWHVDGFQGNERHEPENSYLYMDKHPTEWLNQSFDVTHLDEKKHNFNSYFDQKANVENVVTAEEESIYLFDPYMIHRRPYIDSDVFRTMIRITFSYVEIEDPTCTPNPNIPLGPYVHKDPRDWLIDDFSNIR